MLGTTVPPHATAVRPNQYSDAMAISIGLAACAVSSIFFGSMFVPVRKYDAGDGMFAQWVISTGIMIIGFIATCISEFPGFFPLAMLGGAFWAIGNAAAIPIISRLGLAVGTLIWNVTNCLTGWAGGRYGLFGMKANKPASPILNYVGLMWVILGGILFSRIESEPVHKTRNTSSESASKSDEKARLTPNETPSEKESGDDNEEKKKESKKALRKQRFIGFALALASGVFYGMTFVPVIYMIENPMKFRNYPDDGLSYVFSHYFGIYMTATVIFIGYAIFKRSRPVVQPYIVLPSILSGMLWGIAQALFFVANQHLSQAVTFPIITMLPGCVVSAWSIIYLREIKGKRNYQILTVAMVVTMSGAIMVGLSKFVRL